jgi:pimeloyl-ACP methyl ester carboxylesterase
LSDAGLAPLDNSVRMAPGHHVQIGAARVHVRATPTDDPDAEPALFVHGLGGSAPNWTDFAALLRHRLAIDAIDLPGHGRSAPAVDDDYSPQAYANIVIGYLEQHGRGPVHLVGNSMGGAVSILVASRRPDLVRTLTLISPAVPDNRARVYPLRYDPRMAALAIPGLGGVAMRKMAALPPETRVAGTIALCFADPKRYPPERMREAVAEAKVRQAMPWSGPAFLRSVRGLAVSQTLRGRTGWATIRSITAPTLVLWGDTDRLVAPDLAPYVAAAIPDSRLLVLENIGHTAMMEDPVSSARAMLALLEDAATVRS